LVSNSIFLTEDLPNNTMRGGQDNRFVVGIQYVSGSTDWLPTLRKSDLQYMMETISKRVHRTTSPFKIHLYKKH